MSAYYATGGNSSRDFAFLCLSEEFMTRMVLMPACCCYLDCIDAADYIPAGSVNSIDSVNSRGAAIPAQTIIKRGK